MIPANGPTKVDLKAGDRWYVCLPGEILIDDATVLDVTPKTVLLRYTQDDRSDRYAITFTTRWLKSELNFVEKIAAAERPVSFLLPVRA